MTTDDIKTQVDAYARQILQQWEHSFIPRCPDCHGQLTPTSYACTMCNVLVCDQCRHDHRLVIQEYTLHSESS